MAMTISVPASSPSSVPNTPPSSVDGPHSPISSPPNTVALPPPVESSPPTVASNATAAPAAKRKPSRRANTAERRATHNAVERARRETLNGRFLDLAALLPNLSQIRRPSKSSIVNSSIAHIHASRRHRLLAARELRLVKLEADALRRELNEWRDRASLPRVEEPIRGEGFQMILSGEVEVVSAGPIEEEDTNGDYAGDDFAEEDFANVASGAVPTQGTPEHSPEEMRNIGLLKSNSADITPFAHNVTANNGSLHLQALVPHGTAHSPMIVQSPTSVSFDNSAIASMYDHLGSQQFYINNGMIPRSDDKVAAWNAAQMYAATNMGPQAGQVTQQFTPPASSHGSNVTPPINVSPQQAAYMMNARRQAATMMHGHVFGSPVDGDDTSSVGSTSGGPIRRERSGSMNSVGSGYASGPALTGSPVGNNSNFEMANLLSSSPVNGAMGGNVPRRMNSGIAVGQWEESMGMNVGAMGGMPGMIKGPQAISVGGGGNGHGFAAMMM